MTGGGIARGQSDVQSLVDAGELDAAIAQLKNNPERNAPEIRYLAWLEQRRGDYAASETTLNTLLAQDPQDLEARLLFGYSQWLSGDLATAETAIARVVSLAEPEDPALTARARANLDQLQAQIRDLAPLVDQQWRLELSFLAVIALIVVLIVAGAIEVVRRPAARS